MFLQRKLLLTKKIDPDSLNREDLETTTAPPPNFLTPRSPIVEKDEPKPKSRSNTPALDRRKIPSSKSDNTLSHFAKQNSGSSLGSYGERPDIQTSTPKFPSSQSHNHLTRSYHGGERMTSQADLSQSLRVSDLSQSLRASDLRASQNSQYGHRTNDSQSPYVHRTSVPDTRTAVLPLNLDYNNRNQLNSYGHSPAGSTSSSSSIYSDGRQNNSANHSSSFQQPPVVRQNSTTRKTSEPGLSPKDTNIYNALPKKTSVGNLWPNGGNTLPRQNTNVGNNGSYGDYMPMDGAQRAASAEQLDPRADTRYNAASYNDEAYQPTPARSMNGPSRPESDRNYNPGNVRSLVQNYHKTVKPVDPPVPPPRRSRPVTPGPMSEARPITPGPTNQRRSVTPGPGQSRPTTPGHISSNQASMNSTSSSYCSPSSQRPSYTTINITTGVSMVPNGGSNFNNRNTTNNNPNQGRSLPPRPDDRPPPVPRPGSTPPRLPPPQPPNKDGNPPPKSSVWYEYGCV